MIESLLDQLQEVNEGISYLIEQRKELQQQIRERMNEEEITDITNGTLRAKTASSIQIYDKEKLAQCEGVDVKTEVTYKFNAPQLRRFYNAGAFRDLLTETKEIVFEKECRKL